MKNLFLVFAHISATIARLLRPGGRKALITGNLLLKQQLLIISHSRQRAPNLLPVLFKNPIEDNPISVRT